MRHVIAAFMRRFILLSTRTTFVGSSMSILCEQDFGMLFSVIKNGIFDCKLSYLPPHLCYSSHCRLLAQNEGGLVCKGHGTGSVWVHMHTNTQTYGTCCNSLLNSDTERLP